MGLYESSKDFMNLRSHIELIEKFINELPKTDDKLQTKKIPNPEKLDIVFKDVDYKHPDAKEKIFDKFNLKLYSGEKVAIIGGIGSGKSSAVRILGKLQSYQNGNIFINGISLNNIDINDLREKIVYIPQHPKLFNRTLEDNLTYGLPKDITTDIILKFLKDNGFIELEKIFRKRMKEKVGKLGSFFSGGQIQIIFLIRAFFKKCSLICADEITSALDPIATQQIKKMLNIISKDRAIILITHDMEMTKDMDRIIKFEKGKIISDINKNKKNK